MKVIRYLALPFSLIYAAIIRLRNFAYDHAILKSSKFPIPIINVGNLSFGGTGKSPMIELLVRELSEGNNIAILSRGYGRTTSGYLIADSNTEVTDIGDEPFQFHQKFPKITVAVSEKRSVGIQSLIEEGKNLILLDDAFQHRSVSPGFNILLTKHNDLYCNDFIAPTGNLREPKSGAKRADVIIVTKCPPDIQPEKKNTIVKQLSKNSNQHVYFSHIEYGNYLLSLDGVNKIDCGDLPNIDVILFTGIADDSQLINHLKANTKSLTTKKFADHHTYSIADLDNIRKIFDSFVSESKIVVTTEKDAMRLHSTAVKGKIKDLPIFYLPIEVSFNKEDYSKFIEQIRNYVSEN